MVNSGNKVRLQKLVKEQLKTQIGRTPCNVIYCEGDKSINLNTGVASGDYVFKHTEADTMLISAYAKLRTENYTEAVVLDSEDTDVYVQAAYVSQQLIGDLLIKRKHELINCRTMLSPDVADIIIPLHVITGSDHTSGFYGHGKKPVLEKAITAPAARELLRRVGETLELEDDVRADMKAFVLSNVYSESAESYMWTGQSFQSGTNSRRRVQSVSHLMMTRWITMWKGQTTSRIVRSIQPDRTSVPHRPWLDNREWEVSTSAT